MLSTVRTTTIVTRVLTAASVAGDTDIDRFSSCYAGYAGAARSTYVNGVGTRFGVIGKALGGAFDLGWNHRAAEAYDALCENYRGGDHNVDVVGFSRGAAIALDFVNKVTAHGIQDGDTVVAAKPPIRFSAVRRRRCVWRGKPRRAHQHVRSRPHPRAAVDRFSTPFARGRWTSAGRPRRRGVRGLVSRRHSDIGDGTTTRGWST